MNSETVLVNKKLWNETKEYFDGYVEHLATQKVELPRASLVKLENVDDSVFIGKSVYDTSIVILSENLLDCFVECLKREYDNPALVINTTMYLLADATTGATSESSQLFIRSNAHTVVRDEADDILSLNDVYYMKDVIVLRDSAMDWCRPYQLNAFLYVQKNTEVMVKGSKREFESSEAYDVALKKVQCIFANAVANEHDALILDSFYNPQREYPVDDYIKIINTCIEQYGAYFKTIIIKPMKLTKTKFQDNIQTKAGRKNIHSAQDAHLERDDDSILEDVIISTDVNVVNDEVMGDLTIEEVVANDVCEDRDDDCEEDESIPQISDDDELDEFDKLTM
tara:strand:- start:18332 stop:19348 length:1017 start_codon:yes stop_codon:yes gene_type:complete